MQIYFKLRQDKPDEPLSSHSIIPANLWVTEPSDPTPQFYSDIRTAAEADAAINAMIADLEQLRHKAKAYFARPHKGLAGVD